MCGAALAGLLSVTLLLTAAPASAKPLSASAEACAKKFNECSSRCNGRIPKNVSIEKHNEMLFACIARTCNRQHDNCIANSTQPGGKKTQTSGDPLNPKGTGNRTPPVGGNKSDPKSPPRVNDTRMPPRGGVHGSNTTGSGSNGPILRSNGGGGPSFQSSGRR